MRDTSSSHSLIIRLTAAVLFAVALAICSFFALTADCFAAEYGDDYAASVEFYDDSQLRKVQEIPVPFLDTATVAYTWDFPYSDDFFSTPSDQFSLTFAQGSLGLASSTFRSVKDTVDPQYKTYLRGAGFHDLNSFGYDQETGIDTLSGVIGCKKVGDCTVIAAATCGQGYGNEWAGNLQVGAGDIHEGFNNASKLFEKHLNEYIDDHHIEGKKILWLTGYSRQNAYGSS